LNLFAVPALISAGYHAFALFAGLRKGLNKPQASSFTPAVSVLKPVRGTDEFFAEAIASHARQDYPLYEILFGVASPDDPALAEIRHLQQANPAIEIRLVIAPSDAPNAKVGTLEHLASAARYPVLVVNDSDIRVAPDYLRQVVEPLEDERCGVVTCLYRCTGGSLPAHFESLGVATEFMPSILVARQVGVKEFAMGSTLAFRARDLARIGGFSSIRDYLADDYQLGRRLTELGLGVVLGDPVVETWLGAGKWRDVWTHQVRWSRTIRVSRSSGYFGYIVTQTVWWCLLAAAAGNVSVSLACYAVRMISGLLIAGFVLRDRASVRRWWWMPARDLFGFAVWCAALFGHTVEWRAHRLTVDRDGRIQP
jgi:ceramide glucosyltransferase